MKAEGRGMKLAFSWSGTHGLEELVVGEKRGDGKFYFVESVKDGCARSSEAR